MRNVSVAQLRAQGYRVFVRHMRHFRIALSMDAQIVVPLTNDDPMTRSQINQMVSQISPTGQVVHFETISRGGRTEVEIYNGDALIGKGVARCSDNDGYNKTIGRTIALGRALQSVGSAVDVRRHSVNNVLEV